MAPSCSYSDTNAAYSNALEWALAHLQSLLTNPHSKSWKPVSVPGTTTSSPTDSTLATGAAALSSTEATTVNNLKGKGTVPSAAPNAAGPGPFVNGLAPLDPSQVRVHRKFDSARNADIVRAVAEIPCHPDAPPVDLDAVRAVLSTPEIRPQWDKLVDGSTGLSLLDPLTRITKTDYRLGWPASPRDTITISRTFVGPPGSPSSSSLIDLSTSLPRAADEPAFLRPAPPFVRAHTHLMAWCFQLLPPVAAAPAPNPPAETSSSSPAASTSAAIPAPGASAPPSLRITVFWQWSLRLAAPLSATASASASTSSASSYASPHTAHIAPLIASLVSYLRMSTPGAGPLPLVRGYGDGVEMNRDEWDVQTETRVVDYAVVALLGAGTGSSPTSENREKDQEELDDEAEEDEAKAEEENSSPSRVGGNLQGLDELYRKRERRRLERSIEFSLPPLGVQFPPARPPLDEAAELQTTGGEGTTSGDGWDVRITVKALGGGGGGATTAMTPVSTPGLVARDTALSTAPTSAATTEIDTSYSVSLSATAARRSGANRPPSRLVLRVTHPALKAQSHLLRVTITVQRLAGGKRVRVNGEKIEVVVVEPPSSAAGAAARRRRGVGDLLALAAAGDGDGDGDGEANDAASIETQASSSASLPLVVGSRQKSAADSTGGSGNDEIATVGTTTSPPPPPPASSSAQIASLLRRSYIYFLSLLQEPPAKWRHVTDSAGVSVTQLLSPDPTLTIYRAEAVFVGVGVWDAFATVVTPGVRKTWDKHVEGAVLIADEENGAGAGELSEVWWERRKGVWPVSARDSVLLRTAYKSPSSVHVFSSSTDNTSLFPSIPPPADGTIRVQTDLFGWSIEALSPTTTQITLLDQSDPKGWSSKSSWTPQSLIQAVAGVRDYSLKNGAPPVVTRLGGRVRKTSEEYDPDRSSLRVAYAPIARFNTSESPAIDDLSSMVECEIRCDAHTWATGANGGIEVVVDPPPSNVSCLLRHRLSAGGGLWLTIEHARNVVAEEGRVTVTVRKGSSSSSSTGSSDKAASGSGGSSPTVTINGARIKVDVEVLDDDKVRELEKRKRVKAAPVPLDQYETLGPRSGPAAALARAASITSAAPSTAAITAACTAAAAAAALEPVKDAAVAGQEKGLSALGKALPPPIAGSGTDGVIVGDEIGVGDATRAGAATSAGSTAEMAGTATASPPSKPPLEPPACALEALAWLQTFHAEQGPELTDPAPGWTNVNERGGVVVRKKVLPRISPTIPVYRGDKIVQGLTADEIASIVTSAGCRKSWDDRVETATPLASYGHGVTALALVTKPTFPFRGRFFHVATANAAVKVPSASSGASTSTVLFVASASYVHTSTDPFDLSKLNPQSLPTGQVLLEGWILETLDPYTSSVLAIPSTRCTFVSCTDQKGSVPFALNATLNANLTRSISNVEQFGKTRGPLPRLWTPPLRLQIEGPLSDDSNDDFVWRLEDTSSDGHATPGEGILTDYDAGTSAFSCLVRVDAKTSGSSEPAIEAAAIGTQAGAARKLHAGADKGGGAGKSKPSPLLSPPVPPGSALFKNELSRSTSLNLVSTAPPVLHKAPIMSELSRKSSHTSLRTATTAQSTAGSGAAASATGTSSTSKSTSGGSATTLAAPSAPADYDLLVAEIVVDLKQYPHGYALSAKARTAPIESDAPLSLDPITTSSTSSSDFKVATSEVPLRCVAHDAPLPSILTASLDAWKRANHLVRVRVPTGAITHPIKDPLRDEDTSSKVKAPDWYGAFVAAGGALVDITITALPAPPIPAPDRGVRAKDRARDGPVDVPTSKVTGQANKTVVFNGEKLVVQTQKESRAVLARFEDDDLPLQGAKISRIPPRKRRKSSVAVEIEPKRTTPDTLPPRLQKPLAVSTRLLAPKPMTPVPDEFEFPDPKSPGMTTPATEEAQSPISGGRMALTPAASRRDTVTSTTSTPGGPLLSLLSGYPLSRLTTSMLASTVDVTETSPSGVVAVRRTYTLSFVLVVAIISFLIGSLLRSLLTPADYVIYRPEESAAVHGDVQHALLSALDVNRRWREARRLLELRGLFGWDVMVAAVKRE